MPRVHRHASQGLIPEMHFFLPVPAQTAVGEGRQAFPPEEIGADTKKLRKDTRFRSFARIPAGVSERSPELQAQSLLNRSRE